MDHVTTIASILVSLGFSASASDFTGTYKGHITVDSANQSYLCRDGDVVFEIIGKHLTTCVAQNCNVKVEGDVRPDGSFDAYGRQASPSAGSIIRHITGRIVGQEITGKWTSTIPCSFNISLKLAP